MKQETDLKSWLFKTGWTFLLFLCLALPFRTEASEIINGAGATFPYPIYAKWAYAYAKETGVRLNYQSIGSGGGIRQIKARTVDFGASDAPMKADELEKYGLIQFPMIMGGVVPVINLKHVTANEIRLDANALADIFLGKIKKWDDPRIKSLNPEVELPATDITVVHRSDGSGTTWIFTHYLAAVNPEWAKTVGAGKAVKWPIGLGGKGNEGVAAYVKRVVGSIGYVEYAYAIQNHLTTLRLKNRSGNFVIPTDTTFQAAAAGANWENTPGMAVVLVNQPGENAWPITGASFILMYKNQKDKETALRTLKFFDWCYRNGTEMAKKLFYVPIPGSVYEFVEMTWAKEIKHGDQPIWAYKK